MLLLNQNNSIILKLIFIVIFTLYFSAIFSQNTSKIAILIDDVGNDTKLLNLFFEFDEKISFAVLPFLPKSKESFQLIQEKGYCSILHMPMESLNNPRLNERTKGLIRTDMSKSEIENYLNNAIKNLGGTIVGFNNHMGSKFTSNPQKMYVLLSLTKQKELFYIDSNTYSKISTDGVVPNPKHAASLLLAKAMGVKSSYNSLFIDISNRVSDIENVLLSAIELSKTQNEILLIGHFKKNTAIALNNTKAKMLNAGIEFIFVTELENLSKFSVFDLIRNAQ